MAPDSTAEGTAAEALLDVLGRAIEADSDTDTAEDVSWRGWSEEASATTVRNMGRILNNRMVGNGLC